MGDNAETARAQGLHQRQQQAEVGISGGDGVHQRLRHMEDVALLCEQHDALDAKGKAGCRGRFATELFNETVVAATGGNGALGAKGIGRPLKDGVTIVIKAAYQARIALPGDAEGIQQCAELREVVAAGFAEIVIKDRGTIQYLLHSRVFAVEDAQWIGGKATAAIFIQGVGMLLQVSNECLLEGVAFFSKANGVDFERQQVKDVQATEKVGAKADEFGVLCRAGNAQRFNTHL